MRTFRKTIVSLICWCILALINAQDYSLKIDSFEQVLASGTVTKKADKIELLLDLSHAYLRIDTAKCKAYAMEALNIAQNYGLKLGEANAYNALGNFYNRTASFYHAHNSFINAEKIFLELNNEDRLYSVYKNMLVLFIYIKEKDNIIYYANKVMAMASERKDYMWELNAQRSIGDALYQDDMGQEALDYFLNLYKRALHLEDSLGLPRNSSTVVGIRCANIYHNTGRSQEALPYLHRMREYYESRGIVIDVSMAYDNLAIVYAEMHNVDSAKYYINKAFALSTTNKQIFRLYHASSIVDSLKGNYFGALKNYQKFHHIKDSLSKEEQSTEMARLKLWHEFDQKEIEKRVLQREYQKQKRLTYIFRISSVVIFSLLALTVFFYRKINQKNRDLYGKNCEITEKNCQLEELHATKDKLFSVVAHDLRSPIASLIAVLEMTNINIMDVEAQKLVFKDITQRVDNAYKLLDNLLQWAKSQMHGIAPSPISFDVQTESKAVIGLLQSAASAKKIKLICRAGKHNVYTDKDMFLVVLRNLTTNALKYTSAGGEVVINSELSDNMLIMSVKDTGSGMPQNIQDNLFKLSETQSQRGTENEKGTGLGLVLCADFVKANGGKIWFNSKEGEGSTFYFSVPVDGN